jgi:hypothetical protein
MDPHHTPAMMPSTVRVFDSAHAVLPAMEISICKKDFFGIHIRGLAIA